MSVPSFQMTIQTQYIKDYSVENPRSPFVFAELKSQPPVSIQGDVLTKQIDDNGHYEVALRLTLQMSDDKGQAICIIDLLYAGVFHFAPALENPEHPILFIEAPRFLFPFAREIVASSAIKCGFPPVFIQPIDFAALYHQKQQETQAEDNW